MSLPPSAELGGDDEERDERKEVYVPLAVFGTPVTLTLIHDADGQEAQEPRRPAPR